MGKRSRRRAAAEANAPRTGGRTGGRARAAHTDYEHSDGGVLTLRGALSPGSRRELAAARRGDVSREDAEQRAFELLFERLAVSWTVAGVPTTGQRELLGRLRMATPAERQWVRETLRSHCAECFPDVAAP